MAKNQLPKVIYVRVEQDGDETCLIADITPQKASSGDIGSEECGRYQLVDIGILLTEVCFVGK